MEALRRQIRAYMRGHTTALLVQYKRYGHKGRREKGLPDRCRNTTRRE